MNIENFTNEITCSCCKEKTGGGFEINFNKYIQKKKN